MINSNTPSSRALKVITGMLGENDINQIIKKLRDSSPAPISKTEPIIKSEKKPEKALEQEKRFYSIKDIPVYMTGDSGGFSSFEEQTDKDAKIVGNWNIKDNRHLFDRTDNKTSVEIIKKEEILPRNIKFWKELGYTDKKVDISDENKEKLYDVLHLYLKAYGPRARSVTTIGIKIPEGIDSSSFMEKLAEEVYAEGIKNGALEISDRVLREIGWGGFKKRQTELKNFAQIQFLKYANEQLISKDKGEDKE